jgi:tubulin---tyrosine ligase
MVCATLESAEQAGTPSTCTNIGLHHVSGDDAPFDLVISGPNFGRNSSTVFTLGSGTIGGAMEAALVLSSLPRCLF